MGSSSSKESKAAKTRTKHKAKGPGRTLSENTVGGGAVTGSTAASKPSEARSAAAEAAAARLEKKNGKLGNKLDQQRAKSNTTHLAEEASETLAQREQNAKLEFD